uniref:Uncharacterized protein n=1 Tax=viral metagenome TaxID=1070528 RepID=A0A6M3LR61_9ZZZZ
MNEEKRKKVELLEKWIHEGFKHDLIGQSDYEIAYDIVTLLEDHSSKCQMQTLVVPGNGLPEWWPENPYPESIFPMTDKEYLEAVPNPNLRTAISGFLYRAGWLVATKQISEALRNYLEDLKEA